MKKLQIDKIEILKYWKQWTNSGCYNQNIFFEEIFKKTEKKINEIIKKLNKK